MLLNGELNRRPFGQQANALTIEPLARLLLIFLKRDVQFTNLQMTGILDILQRSEVMYRKGAEKVETWMRNNKFNFLVSKYCWAHQRKMNVAHGCELRQASSPQSDGFTEPLPGKGRASWDVRSRESSMSSGPDGREE